MTDTIIHDLTIVVVCAGIVSYVFSRFNWPVILGYLLAGVLVGPNTFYDSPVLNIATIESLSELGVVFLMFYIGMEFDLGKLKSLVGSALPAVLLQTLGMVFLGVMTAPVFGWSSINGLFLGGVLAISSTMVTFGVMREQGTNKHSHGQLAVGILILEDIVAIILLVVLAGVGERSVFDWGDVGQSIFLVGVFVMVVFVAGKMLTPRLIKRLQVMDNLEVILLVAVGMMLGLGSFAEYVDLSIALGAFLGGAILSQSILAHQIEGLVEPFRYLFSAIFFVTVGMLIDPSVLLDQWGPIIFVATLVVVGKGFTCWLGLGMSGQNLRNSFRAALCKAQIGEFSFIIAKLGQSMGVTDARFESLTVGVALVTILATPLISRHSDPLFDVIAKKIPQPVTQLSRLYFNLLQIAREKLGRSDLLLLIHRPLLQILGYFLLFSGVIIGTSMLADYVALLKTFGDYLEFIKTGVWIAGAICCLPFLVAVIRNLDAITMIITEAVLTRSAAQQFAGGRLGGVVHNILLSIVLILFGGVFLSAATAYLPSGVSLLVFSLLLFGVGFFAWKKLVRINSRLENLFLESLEKHVKKDEERRQAQLQKISEKYPWPINLIEVIVDESSVACGRSILDLALREKSGASVLAIGRGGYIQYHPHPATVFFPGDRVFIAGDEAQNESAKAVLIDSAVDVNLKGGFSEGFEIKKLMLGSDSILIGETLASADLRRLYGVTIVGLQRGDKRIASPLPEEILQVGDLLLVAGAPQNIADFPVGSL
jgi:CPA2 family monovalent cation:H+ antiporter-2